MRCAPDAYMSNVFIWSVVVCSSALLRSAWMAGWLAGRHCCCCCCRRHSPDLLMSDVRKHAALPACQCIISISPVEHTLVAAHSASRAHTYTHAHTRITSGPYIIEIFINDMGLLSNGERAQQSAQMRESRMRPPVLARQRV